MWYLTLTFTINRILQNGLSLFQKDELQKSPFEKLGRNLSIPRSLHDAAQRVTQGVGEKNPDLNRRVYVWLQDQRLYSKVSGWSCECVVLSRLVTFNVPIDVLSTHQRGHGHVCERESDVETRLWNTSTERRWCSVRHMNVGWPGFQQAPQVSRHCEEHRWPLGNPQRGEREHK